MNRSHEQYAELYTITNEVIKCSCPSCLIEPISSHQHHIFLDNSIQWHSSKQQKMRELRDKAKAYGITVEQARNRMAEGKL